MPLEEPRRNTPSSLFPDRLIPLAVTCTAVAVPENTNASTETDTVPSEGEFRAGSPWHEPPQVKSRSASPSPPGLATLALVASSIAMIARTAARERIMHPSCDSRTE